MNRFNVRVYGLWISQGAVLVCEEYIRGAQVLKFPGGGLELGEGTLDCLHREFREEMNLEISVLGHYYTTDYFQPSAFDDSQVLSIYYAVEPRNEVHLPLRNEAGHFFMLPLADLLQSLSLPIDKKVAALLCQQYLPGSF